LKSYRCEGRYGYAWVVLDEPLLPIPELKEDADPAFRRIPQFYERWSCNAFRLMENSFDSAHPAFVHRKSFGNIERPDRSSASLTMTPWGFISRHETQVVNRGNAAAALRVQGETTVRKSETLWFMPFARRLGITYPERPQALHRHQRHAIDDHSMMLSQWCYRNDREEDVPASEVVAWDRRNHRGGPRDPGIDRVRRVHRYPPPGRVPHGRATSPGSSCASGCSRVFRAHGEEEVHLLKSVLMVLLLFTGSAEAQTKIRFHPRLGVRGADLLHAHGELQGLVQGRGTRACRSTSAPARRGLSQRIMTGVL
jgi:hypothetical protein